MLEISRSRSLNWNSISDEHKTSADRVDEPEFFFCILAQPKLIDLRATLGTREPCEHETSGQDPNMQCRNLS